MRLLVLCFLGFGKSCFNNLSTSERVMQPSAAIFFKAVSCLSDKPSSIINSYDFLLISNFSSPRQSISTKVRRSFLGRVKKSGRLLLSISQVMCLSILTVFFFLLFSLVVFYWHVYSCQPQMNDCYRLVHHLFVCEHLACLVRP